LADNYDIGITMPVAREAIEKLLNLFEIAGVGADDLKGALTLPISDMEDALQAWCAKKVNAESIITRDKDGFINFNIPELTPAEFIL